VCFFAVPGLGVSLFVHGDSPPFDENNCSSFFFPPKFSDLELFLGLHPSEVRKLFRVNRLPSFCLVRDLLPPPSPHAQLTYLPPTLFFSIGTSPSVEGGVTEPPHPPHPTHADTGMQAPTPPQPHTRKFLLPHTTHPEGPTLF